jgi:hypothetical protein
MIELITAIGLLLGGILGYINALRRQVKAYAIYGACWVGIYLGGHIIIAYLYPHYFSPYASVWTILFTVFTGLALGALGGLPLDSTIAVACISNEQMETLCSHSLILRMLLPLWKNIGIGFLKFLRMMFMVSILLGLFFLYFPPSNSWRMFFATAVAFIGYNVSGIDFNWKLWRKVVIWSMWITITLGALTPFVAPIFKSYLIPIQKSVVAPMTSSYAITTQDTTAWLDDKPTTFKAGTWLCVVDGSAQDYLGLQVVAVRRAVTPKNPRSGFDKDHKYLVILQDINRRDSLGSNTNSSAAPEEIDYTSFSSTGKATTWPILLIAILTLGFFSWKFFGKKTAPVHTGDNHAH